jgi:hypothetical protein
VLARSYARGLTNDVVISVAICGEIYCRVRLSNRCGLLGYIRIFEGSYPEPESGLSKIALEWMLCEAQPLGLLVDPQSRPYPWEESPMILLAGDLTSDGFATFWSEGLERIPDFVARRKTLEQRFGVATDSRIVYGLKNLANG